MSEEEIIHYIKLCIENKGIPSEGLYWVKGLLDLYNKQKKEIRRLKQNTMVLAKELDEQQEEINSLEEELELGNAITKAQFVSKDKIREKIEEYEKLVKDFEEYWSKDPRQFKKEKCVDYYKIEALKELLEEN